MAYSRYDVKSPVEKIIEILKNLQENLKKEEEDVKKIAWCIEIISNNRLYDPILENLFKENSNQKEVFLSIFIKLCFFIKNIFINFNQDVELACKFFR